LAHVIACCMIVMDGLDRKSIIDNRDESEVLTGKLSQNSVDYLDSREPMIDPK